MATIPLERLAEHMNASLEETARAVKMKMFTQVIMDTRVGNPDGWQNPGSAPPGYVGGRLRGNWQTTTGRPASEQIERIDPTGAAAITETLRVKPDTVDYITNNLPYAEVWEQNDGMVARAVARLERTIKEAAK